MTPWTGTDEGSREHPETCSEPSHRDTSTRSPGTCRIRTDPSEPSRRGTRMSDVKDLAQAGTVIDAERTDA
ncbi:predicted protein [Streptomyces sp. C]|nr:predicted protein [Streptomyces sp. C]